MPCRVKRSWIFQMNILSRSNREPAATPRVCEKTREIKKEYDFDSILA